MNPPIHCGLKLVLTESPEAQAVLAKLEIGSRLRKEGPIAVFEIPAKLLKSIKPETDFVNCVCEDRGLEWWLILITGKNGLSRRINTEHHWAIPK